MYNLFKFFICRTPYYPINSLNGVAFEVKISHPQFQEAIYIASPVLYAELQKYLAGAITNTKEKQRIESALYRYISRMSTRCTPFGLFAGCSIGCVAGDKTNIILGDYHRHTRMDMYFLCILSRELSKLSDIKHNIRYYPNTTLYQLGKKYRYVECQYVRYKRISQISAIDRSVYLDTILKMARKGIKINELLIYLKDKEIESDEALKFIEKLIDSQIIVSEIDPSITGDDFFSRIIYILEELHVKEPLISSLKEVREMTHHLDFNQHHIGLYKSIIQKIKKINITYEEKNLFQVDITRSVVKATLGKDIVNELRSTMIFLNKITISQKNETLSQFQRAFYNRYEDKEVPLMEALDPEFGIGYPLSGSKGNISPLLENFHTPIRLSQASEFQSNKLTPILLKKTIDAVKQNKSEIIFSEDDVKNFNTNWDDLTPTIYSMFKILKSENDNPLIHLSGFYGTCGANLFTRFSYTNKNITQFVNEITVREKELMPDVLFAEIAHFPDDSRAGNILFRPHIRDYEILYLANSDLPENRTIHMSDLFLSVRKGRIYLRSKKMNREIVPRLTNAHNYRKNAMPVYYFLCDIQIQYERESLSFDWGHLKNELSFLPRVRYKNTILSPATWKIRTEEMKNLFVLKDNDKLLDETQIWCKKYSFPSKMLLVDGDNELLVDWKDLRSIRALFSIIKKREMVSLKELLYDPENYVVKDESGNFYLNECIVAFYKTK